MKELAIEEPTETPSTL